MSIPFNSHNFEKFEVNFTIFPNSSSTFTFLADPLGYSSPYTFSWDFGDGHTYTTSQLWAQHTYKEVGNYTVALTANATIYSGDSVSASAPLQIVEVNDPKTTVKTGNRAFTNSQSKIEPSIDYRINDVYSRHIGYINTDKNARSDIFEDLHLDMDKLILRMATVISADPIPENHKFIKLQVNMGSKKRTVISKNKESSFPDKNQLIGRKVILVTNLAPLSFGGLKSQGLLLEDLGISNSAEIVNNIKIK